MPCPPDLLITELAGRLGNSLVGIGGPTVKSIPSVVYNLFFHFLIFVNAVIKHDIFVTILSVYADIAESQDREVTSGNFVFAH